MSESNFRVVGVAPNAVQIEVLDTTALKNEEGDALRIGSFLRIFDHQGLSVIAVVRSYRIRQEPGVPEDAPSNPKFIIEAQPIGHLDTAGTFSRGGQQIAIPPTDVRLATTEELRAIFGDAESAASLVIGTLSSDASIPVPLDGDVFFGRHVAVVGSTGSGKSCTVARILQQAMLPADGVEDGGVLRNAHAVIFDLHGEYATAFPEARLLNIDNLKLPYWLMTAEELEELFIESKEQNSHNQISQFRHAVQKNKQLHNGDARVSYDSPVFFSIEEVYNYLVNMNKEVIGKEDKENVPKLKDGTLVADRDTTYFEGIHEFVPPSRSKGTKANNGPFAGDFERFVLRLRSTLDMRRLEFLFRARRVEDGEYRTEHVEELISTLIGYGEEKQNVTIVNLKGIPFEVHSLVVSLISRIIFDVGVALRSRSPANRGDGEIAFLAVYEEAHKYVPGSDLARFRAVRKSIERIAKEGRKYGVALMIVSQRPSEISETVFSQCNSFVVMRLTNPADQNYVRRLLPDALSGVTDALPSLAQRHALLVGEAVQVPTLIEVGEISDRPSSEDIDVLQEWRKGWQDLPFDEVLDEMQGR